MAVRLEKFDPVFHYSMNRCTRVPKQDPIVTIDLVSVYYKFVMQRMLVNRGK